MEFRPIPGRLSLLNKPLGIGQRMISFSMNHVRSKLWIFKLPRKYNDFL